MATEQAHHGHYGPLVNVIGRAVEAGLDLYLEACGALPDEVRRPLRAVAAECTIDADYLGWLLRVGRVAGAKRGGRWYVSVAAVRRYQEEVTSGAIPDRAATNSQGGMSSHSPDVLRWVDALSDAFLVALDCGERAVPAPLALDTRQLPSSDHGCAPGWC